MPDTPNPMNPYGGRDNDDEGKPNDGLEDMLRNLIGGGHVDPNMVEALRGMGLGNMDPATLGMVQAQFQAMMGGGQGEAFNVDAAKNVARRVAAQSGDPSIPTATVADMTQVVQVADLWLDEVTSFSAPTAPVHALSRAEWVEETMPVWRKVVEPVATGVGHAISDAMMKQLGQMDSSDLSQFGIPEGMLPPGFDVSQLREQMMPMLKQMSGSMFAMQVGQAIGALAAETVSGTEVGLPLMDPPAVVLLPSNVAAFADGLEIDPGEVNLYLAVREAARARLFAGAHWLGPALVAAVQSYAGDIKIDTEAIEEKLREVDPNDAEAMHEALAGNMFSPEPSKEQKRTLAYLETLLALVEGWVDSVTEAATRPHLPHQAALAEAVRRRRATGGPAEKVFASLVGLELRPRRLREAAQLWQKLTDASDADTRDKAWSHPDFAPTGDDLGAPDAYVAKRTGQEVAEPVRDEMDDELDKLLAQGRAEMDGDTKGNSGSNDAKDSDAKDSDARDDEGPTPGTDNA